MPHHQLCHEAGFNLKTLNAFNLSKGDGYNKTHGNEEKTNSCKAKSVNTDD